MKRPKAREKLSIISMCGMLFLMLAFIMGTASDARAASGSFDRTDYMPSSDDTDDHDRVWFSITDSSGNTTSSPDTITATVKASDSNSTSFVLKETSGSSTVFTVTGSSQPSAYPVGSTSGYVEDFFTGSHNYPGLGSSIVGLNLKTLTINNQGSADTGTDGNLTIEAGNTLELVYGGSTLDTANVGYNEGSFSFSPSTITAVTTDSSVNPNVIISVTDPDENTNPVLKDVIGFADNAALLSGTPGTGSSRVQVEALDQTTGSRLTNNSVELVTTHIMLTETGNNTGVFSASGKVFGTSTTVASSDLKGNLRVVGSSTSGVYTGDDITLGDTAGGPSVTFKIIEVNGSGRLGLFRATGTNTSTNFGTASLGFVSPSSDSFVGTSSWSIGGKVVAFGTDSVAWGDTVSTNTGSSTNGLIKLFDGSAYCLVSISAFQGTNTVGDAAGDTAGATYEIGSGDGGSVTVSFDAFELPGARSGDTIKVSYLDEFKGDVNSGTATGSMAYGVSGVTGVLSVDKSSVDINDYLTVTLADANLNTASNASESVASGSSLWSGTTTNRRGDTLGVKAYQSSSQTISLSHVDGSLIGTQSIRISSTDQTYVWVVPTSGGGVSFGDPTSAGSIAVSLGTQSVSNVPLVRGSSSEADDFLSSASTSSFEATLNGLDNTVEISPDGTRWVSVPMVESGGNTGTFVGTIGFDTTAARLTTDTTKSASDLLTDFSGTTTIKIDTGAAVTSFIGTGSVVRIADDAFSEFSEVTGVAGTEITVAKLSNSSFFTPWKTWVQVIGNDMMTQRLDDGKFKIGGFHDATYRLRYNDSDGDSGEYLAGDTLAVTTSNVGFTTYTGELSVSPSGSVGPNSTIVVTLVDNDLNTSTGSKQSTFHDTSSIANLNEVGLGLPSGTSTGNAARGFKDGGDTDTDKPCYKRNQFGLREFFRNDFCTAYRDRKRFRYIQGII